MRGKVDCAFRTKEPCSNRTKTEVVVSQVSIYSDGERRLAEDKDANEQENTSLMENNSRKETKGGKKVLTTASSSPAEHFKRRAQAYIRGGNRQKKKGASLSTEKEKTGLIYVLLVSQSTVFFVLKIFVSLIGSSTDVSFLCLAHTRRTRRAT